MTIKITLEFSTPAEAAAALLKFAGGESVAQQVEVKREAAKAAKPKAEKTAEPVPAPAPVTAPAPETEVQEPVTPVDYPAVQAAILKVANAKGRDTALGILATFNAKAGKELKPEQYEAALAAFNSALEG